MTDIASAPSGVRTVTAFFDTSDHATQARADLIGAGIPETDITVVGSAAELSDDAVDHHRSFWEKLADFFMPDEDRRAYEEGLRRGGFALSVRAGGALYERAIDVLDRDGAVDLDERTVSWEAEGWSRPAAASDAIAGATVYQAADASTAGFGGSYAGEDGLGSADETAAPAGEASADREGRGGDPDQLFGRRDLSHGRTRVRSYVVDGERD